MSRLPFPSVLPSPNFLLNFAPQSPPMAPLLLCVILLFPISSLAQNNATIPTGASLTATENSNPWRSPSGDFAFGFQQLPDNKDVFVLSIWFDNIPNKTIVWYEKGSYPVPRGSTVRLDVAEGIVLRDPGGRLLYRTDGLTARVDYGFMNETGNFILWRRDSTSLWESFRNPTDTILPTQTIEIDGELISRKTGTNFSDGKFYARMNSDGNFVLKTKSAPSDGDFEVEYFNTHTSDANDSNSGYQMVFDERAALSVRRRNGRRVDPTLRSNIPPSDYYHRATLDFDGIFALYYHPKKSDGIPGWTVANSWPDNICVAITNPKGTGPGACGYNNVCRLENRRPVCQCPTGFSLADPNNSYGDCNPTLEQNCIPGDQHGPPEDKFELQVISNFRWPYNDYQKISPSTEEQCRSLCLNDCFSGVAVFHNMSCWKKKLPLSNGRVDTSIDVKAFFKFRKDDLPGVNPNRPTPNKPKKDRGALILAGSVLLGSSVFVNVLFVGASCLGFFLIYNKKLQFRNLAQNPMGPTLRCFTYEELEQATYGFKEEVGRGAFGIVYKGVIPGCQSIVAVKKLDRVLQDSEKEFRNEVNAIGQTYHKNLVRLIGFCDEGAHRLLVYEYMSNGTLAGFLFGDARPSWSQRIQIALGIARGLTYLHDECTTQIIHCDIKPQNILLDEYYNALISDFGLAKLLMMNQSRTLTNIRGTRGYVAPEWFRNTQITMKVDVYSFGVLLLEIITCRKSLDWDLELGDDGKNPILIDWVCDCFAEGKVDCLAENDEEALNDRRTLERFVMVGIWCIQEDASMRPTMRKACLMLEGILEVEVPPCPCLFTSTF